MASVEKHPVELKRRAVAGEHVVGSESEKDARIAELERPRVDAGE